MRLEPKGRAGDNESPSVGELFVQHGAEHHRSAKGMADGDYFPTGDALDMSHEGGRVIGPLRPSVDVSALPRALAVPAEVHGKGGVSVPRHPQRKALVAPGVVAEPMHHCERDLRARPWPSAI